MNTDTEQDTILVGTSRYPITVIYPEVEQQHPNSGIALDVMDALQAETDIPIITTHIHFTIQTTAPLVIGESYAMTVDEYERQAQVIEELGTGRYELKTSIY